MYYGESGYMRILEEILERGTDYEDRTGVGCRKIFNVQLKFDLNNGYTFPILTARPTPLRIAFEELWLFLRGDTDTKNLEAKNVNIWKGNTSREFLDENGLNHLPEGSLGKSYSYQYTNFSGSGVNQIEKTLENLKENPFSRRHVVSIWNPADADEMPLQPCFFGHQFYVMKTRHGENQLNLKVYSRSWDITFGGPFNIGQFALYLLAMAKASGMMAGELVIDATDVHIYQNQIPFVQELVTRRTYSPANVRILPRLDTYQDIIDLQFEDISIINLKVNKTPFRTEKPPMAV